MKKMYLDIETEDEYEMKSFQNKILSISCYVDEKYVTFLLSDKKYDFGGYYNLFGKFLPWTIFSVNDEKLLLDAFLSYVLDVDPDMIIGWNVSSFDVPYIVNRMKELGIDYSKLSPVNVLAVWELSKEEAPRWYMQWGIKLVGRIVFDLMHYYTLFHVTGVRSTTLDAIAKEELGIGKLQGRPAKLYKEDMDKFLLYNIRDVDLVVGIDKKCGVSDFALMISRITGAELDDLFYKSQIIDTFMLYNKEYALPTKSSKVERVTYEGAIVRQPEIGLKKNVVLFDVSRMYPSIILSCNLSPEVVVENDPDAIVLPTGLKVARRLGFVPKFLKNLFDMRQVIEKKLENTVVGSEEYEILMRQRQVIKDTINSVYGQFGYVNSRIYHPKIAETVTAMGRMILTKCMEYLENKGYRVIYGDTDSVFIKYDDACSKEYIVEDAKRLLDDVNDALKEEFGKLGLDSTYFNVDFEKAYSSFFIKNKKRYAGKVFWKDKFLENEVLEIRGFEYRRSDTSRYFAQKQAQLLEKVLLGKKEECDAIVFGMISDIMSGSLSLFDVCRPITIGLDMSSYKVNTPQMRAVEWSNRYLGTSFGVGSKVYLVPVKAVFGYPATDVLACDEETELPKMIVNWEKIATDVWRKCKMIYDALGWEMPEIDLKTGIRQEKLMTWVYSNDREN